MAKNIFNSVQLQDTPSNVFDLSHDIKLSCNMGDLIPVMCEECIPGDKFNISQEALTRLAPMTAPPMHYIAQYFHTFFIPHRILWAGWEDFITPSTGDDTPAFPTVVIGSANCNDPVFMEWYRGSPMDYLGIPDPGVSTYGEKVSALPFAGLQRVYLEYYRDRNMDTVDLDPPMLVDGDNTSSLALQGGFETRKRAWEHDYFTSALPWANAGTTVNIPLGAVELYPDGFDGFNKPQFRMPDDTAPGSGTLSIVSNDNINSSGSPSGPLMYDPAGTLGIGAASIIDLRRASKLQEWLERLALGGRRYKETMIAIFNVDAGDARLQRPEYITGTKSPIVISEVLATNTNGAEPLGQMGGHGLSIANGSGGSYFVREHGYIMTIMSVLPATAYQQGIPKHFLKYTDALQHYFPQFADIGEQPIENRELYAFQSVAIGATTFGYVPRYSEYKFSLNRVAGDFRASLDFWHMGRKFDSLPVLNSTFIESNPTHRIFAVEDPEVHKLYVHVFNRIRAVRKMPKYGTGRL